jgi:hypothetical protein
MLQFFSVLCPSIYKCWKVWCMSTATEKRGYKGKTKTSVVWTRKPQDGYCQLKRPTVRSMLSNCAHPLGGTLAIMRHECSPTAPDHQDDFPVFPQGSGGQHVPPLPNPVWGQYTLYTSQGEMIYYVQLKICNSTHPGAAFLHHLVE